MTFQAWVARAGGEGTNCPGPWCDRYEFACFDAPSCAWPAGAGGLIHVEYWINPRQPWMNEGEAIGGISAAFSAWEAANPRFRMRYMGTTDRVAASDDRLVVSFMDPGGGGTTIFWGRDEAWLPPDVILGTRRFAWHPCQQADNSCGVYEKRNWWQYQLPPLPEPLDSKVHWYTDQKCFLWPDCNYSELQKITTHEIGHVLGLGDLYGLPDGDRTRGLTMNGTCDGVPELTPTRCQSTVGLGEILGLRVLYPWKCPTLKPGETYPPEYRLLCPTIKVFSP